MKNLNYSRFFLTLFIFLVFSSFVNADECEVYRRKFLVENKFSDSDMKIFKVEVDQDKSHCLKNLLGVMFYKGIYFEQDAVRAERIFYDLSDKGYPESTLNFASLLTKKLDQNPEDVLVLLLGLYKSNATDKLNSHLATKARDLARSYIEKLPDMLSRCHGNESKYCSSQMINLKNADVISLTTAFELSLRNLQAEVALNSINETRSAREKVDNIMSILALGLVAYNIANLAQIKGSSVTSAPSTSGNQNPWFNYNQGFGNPLGLYQFQLH